MKYGLYNYNGLKGFFNIGDHIQSIAAEQFLPRVDVLIDKENVSEYSGETVKMIMNGWYIKRPETWPPQNNIIPLLISMHLNSNYVERFFSKKATVDYLKKNGPVGCRDYFTKRVMEEHGIDAYYSGCLTLTLGRTFKKNSSSGEVLIVDPALRPPKERPWLVLNYFCRGFFYYWRNSDFRISYQAQNSSYFDFKGLKGAVKKYFQVGVLAACVDKELLVKAKYLRHSFHLSEYDSNEKRFAFAKALLQRYANAKLIITSRIHCALPATSLSTPVVFIDVGYNNVSDDGRVASMNRFFNNIFVRPKKVYNDFGLIGKVNENSNIIIKREHLTLRERLEKACESFVKEGRG